MCRYRCLFFIASMAFLMVNTSYADSLTPPHEPKDNSFYVCYEGCQVKYAIRAPLATYRKLQYHGCVITRKPCDTICLHKAHCPGATLKLFGWFNNYPQTLNAFYRCAYS